MRHAPALLLLFALAARGQEPVVLHAVEPPEHWAMSNMFLKTVVQVVVDRDGIVESTLVLRPVPFIQDQVVAAAAAWRFAPSDTDRRVYTLTFEYIRTLTDKPAGRVVTRPDELTLRTETFISTVEWLPRVHGRVPTEFCPVHRDALLVEVAPIRYGLLRGYSSDDPADRSDLLIAHEYWDAKQERFPRSSRFAGGGCTVGITTHAEVRYCRACRRAEETWLRQHPYVVARNVE